MKVEATVVGGRFASGTAKHIMRSLLPGDTVQLLREPDNKFDQNAVAVYAMNERIGYIERGVAPQISDFIAIGGTVVATIDSFSDTLTPYVTVEFLDA